MMALITSGSCQGSTPSAGRLKAGRRSVRCRAAPAAFFSAPPPSLLIRGQGTAWGVQQGRSCKN